MQTFRVPAAYRRHVVAAIARAAREAHHDAMYRAEDDDNLRSWAPVPDAMLEPEAVGDVLIVVGVEAPAAPPTPVLPCT